MTASRFPVLVRITFCALVLLVAIVAGLGASQILAARASQQRQIENGEKATAHLASSALSSALDSRLELISNLADQPALAKLFAPSGARELPRLGPALHLLYPGFASFDVIASDGRLEARWPADPTVIGADVSSKNFFTGAMRTERPYVSEALQQTAPPRELVVGLVAPVRGPSGKIVGLLQGTISAASLGSIIGGTTLAGGGQLVIVDQAGHVLSGPAAGAGRSFASWDLLARALHGQTGSGSGAIPGFSGTRLAGYAPVPAIHWAVVAEQPVAALDGPLADLTKRLIAIGVAVLILAIGTAFLVGVLLSRVAREHDQAGALMACVGEGVATLDTNGCAVLANPALARLTGRAEEDIVGRSWDEALPLYDAQGRVISWDCSMAREAIRAGHVVASSGYDLHLGRADGRRLPVALTAAPLVADDELLGAVVVLRDVSHEREVDQLKSSLVSTVSHELRTPLTMIQGFSELLVTRPNLNDESSREALGRIHVSAERLARLIDDLLSVSRIESGKLRAELGPVGVAEVIAESVSAFSPADRGRVAVAVEDDLPNVTADRDKMVQVVTNLVSNGLKYSGDDSPVCVTATSAGDHVEVSVIDLGIGMSAQECSVVFEKFTRSDRPEVRRVGGTGLGLYITKSLVELQQGQLWVTSTLGKGSVFAFSVPVSSEMTEDSAMAEERFLEEALDR